jgi:hypothetical protein
MEKDKAKKEKKEKEQQTVVELENLTCPIQYISKMEEIVMDFWELLPSNDSQQIKLFYNELDNEIKRSYLEVCITNTEGTSEEIGRRMLNLTQRLMKWQLNPLNSLYISQK